jgi:hypothetical protein
MQPTRVEFTLSNDVYGRPTKLVFGTTGSRMGWTIERDVVDQRDEPARVDLLTDTQLCEIGRIAEQFGRKGA